MAEEEKSKLKGLRTLQSDIQESAKKGVSFGEITTSLEKGGDSRTKEETGRFSLVRLLLVSLVIAVLAGVGFGVFWLLVKKNQEAQPVSLGPKPILVSDEQIVANTDLESIKAALQTQVQVNHLLDISIAAEPAKFLSIINANPPGEFIDSLGNRFMLAKFSLINDWPILILSVNSYESAFAGIIKWEKNMGKDLNAIFNSGAGGDFQDKVIQNHDTRVSPVLIYSFINQNYLVITQNEEPLREIFRRFSSPQYLNE